MAFNQFGQYSGNHKAWDHVGNILPNVEHSEGERPSIEWKVAEWLPVQFFDKHYENWIVLMPGKVVACDPDGKLCPAGMKIAAELAGSGDVLTYTLNDVQAGTINVATGSAVTAAELTDPGSTRGYTKAEIDAAGFLGQSGRAFSVSNPVGVAPFAYLQWAGGDGSNPADYRQHNYNMQHLVTVLCDYVLELPLVPAATANEALTFDAPVDNVACLSGGNVLSNLPVAGNTLRTPITFADGGSGDAGLFLNQVDSQSDIEVAGDWSIDLDSGVICVHSTGTPSGVTVSYSHYGAAPATVSVFASAVGDLKCGDLLTFDANSNLRLADAASLFIGNTSAGDESANVARSHGLIVGQVLDRDAGIPKDYLDRVRTAYVPPIGTDASGSKPGYLGQMDQMPGSATGGAPSNVHYAGAADTVVRVNLTRF
jgi:hypothetical protein